MAQRLDRPSSNETGGLSPDSFLKLYRELRQARTPMESAVSSYRMARKRMKDGGVDDFALGILERLVKVEEDQAALHIRNLFKYANWTNANIGMKQADLFSEADEPAPSEEVRILYTEQLAEENGHAAGLAGEKFDANPYQAGTPQHAAYGRGWHRGQAEKVQGAFGAKAARPPKQPTRRGRNPAAETREAPTPLLPTTSEGAAAEGTGGADSTGPGPAGDAGVGGDNVVQLGRAKRPARAAAAATASPKSRRAALKAADALGGAPVTSVADGKPVF